VYLFSITYIDGYRIPDLAEYLPLCGGVGGTKAVLRISVSKDSRENIGLHLEGRLVGAWVEELRALSDKALSAGKIVTLDLEKLLFVDSKGLALLRELGDRQVTHINCSPFISQQLKETVL
jgi:ABC-type transporter Mla MlaB component